MGLKDNNKDVEMDVNGLSLASNMQNHSKLSSLNIPVLLLCYLQ